MTKVATKYAPPSQPVFETEALLVRQSVDYMSPEQFAVYDSALRRMDYYSMTPAEQYNYSLALRAANERLQREAGFNVTIRDGNRASTMPQLPFGLQWTPLVAIAGVLILVAVIGRR
jgi:hypothetical protein